MTKEEIKNYVTGLCELNLLDFYNSIACNFYSSDAMIHHNTNQFFRDEFLSLQDAEVSKQNPNYKPTDKYVLMLEYMRLKSSSNIYDLIDLNELVNLTSNYIDEVLNMEIIQFEPTEINLKTLLSRNSINTLERYKKSFKCDFKKLKKVFKGRGKNKGYLFTEICHNDFTMIYEKKYNHSVKYQVFPRLINLKTSAELYPTEKDFKTGIAIETETLRDAVTEFYKITKQIKKL